MKNVYQLSKDRLVILSGHLQTQRVHDTAHSFVQESNFYWITAINEPAWQLIIDGKQKKSYLVEPEFTREASLFEGKADSIEILKNSGVGELISSTQASKLISDLSKAYNVVHSLKPDKNLEHARVTPNAGPVRLWDQLGVIFKERKDIRKELAEQRAIKNSDELNTMMVATGITIESFANVKKKISSVMYEYELEAELSYVFRKAGSAGHAYEPIVASGKNALTLHYTKNNDRLPKNGLVLIDAGARVKGYCADVTRTYAIGTPTDRQKAVHAAVEKAHHAIIALLGPEKSVKEYHDEVDEIMKSALRSLGLYKKPSDYRTYFPHAVSHGLGIDVHDSLGAPTHFKPGMVLTVEPGIYIPEEGIGVRIEDDILITETGIENLTGALPTSL